MHDHEKLIWYRRQAIAQWESDHLAVNEMARVAASDEGAWVEAWVWIDAPADFDDEAVMKILEEELDDDD